MGISERKERERAELRSRILEVAEELFVKEGYGNVSMRKIAREIEYSPTTIYRYFKNKAEIMEHLIAQGYRGVRERYEVILASPGKTPFDTLSMIIHEYVDFALKHPNHYHLWYATSALQEKEGALLMRHGGLSYQVYQVWIDLIEECRDAGQLPRRDTHSLFQLLWGCVHGLISLRLQHPAFPWLPPRDQVRDLLSLFEEGLDPR